MNFLKSNIVQFLSKDEGEKGAAAVEFAIGGGVVVIAVIMLIEILMILLINVLLEGGMRNASRFGITGNVGADGRQAQILSIIEDHTLGLVDMDTISVNTFVYESFEDIGTAEDFDDTSPANGEYDEGESFTDSNGNAVWDADRGTPGLGGADDIVLYVIEYDLPFMSGILNPLVGKDNVRLTTSIPVKNEPYNIVDE